MMKRYLLILNEQYYPSHGANDWIGCYENEEDAITKGKELKEENSFASYYVVDLMEWMEWNY